ncbi:hypothetical protein MKEN_01361100 [Mycena kentingensis (nom. inval.)]|nr:hypothetical protein MKEN_01361100 [Mycena kentingensis (nom. inval.)]
MSTTTRRHSAAPQRSTGSLLVEKRRNATLEASEGAGGVNDDNDKISNIRVCELSLAALKELKTDYTSKKQKIENLLVEVDEELEKRELTEAQARAAAAAASAPLWRSTPPPPAQLQLAAKLNREHAKILQDVFGIDTLTMEQAQLVDATMRGKDAFGVLPTGSGKSLSFQLSAFLANEREGKITIVVSPLVALIEDQVLAMERIGVKAVALKGGDQSPVELEKLLLNGRPALVYITPEKLELSSCLKHILAKLNRMKLLHLFVFDEAHWLYTWYFRQAYRTMSRVRSEFQNVPITALTATASAVGRQEIVAALGLHDPLLVRSSLDRSNLFYEILPRPSTNTTNFIVNYIKREHPGESGILYLATCKSCERMAENLTSKGIPADYYHGQMPAPRKSRAQQEWMEGRIRVIVATEAFGLGVNKKDVRFIIHVDTVRKLENFYQETGRAGRDGLPAKCLLLYSLLDFERVLWPSSYGERPTAIDRENALEVLAFVEHKTECIRRALLRKFDEQAGLRCEMCVNCTGGEALVTKNVASEATRVVSLIRNNYAGSGRTLTMLTLGQLLYGTLNKSTEPHAENRAKVVFKAFHKSLEQVGIDVMLQKLVRVGALGLRPVSLPRQTCWDVKLGPNADNFLDSDGTLMITYHDWKILKKIATSQPQSAYAPRLDICVSSPRRDSLAVRSKTRGARTSESAAARNDVEMEDVDPEVVILELTDSSKEAEDGDEWVPGKPQVQVDAFDVSDFQWPTVTKPKQRMGPRPRRSSRLIPDKEGHPASDTEMEVETDDEEEEGIVGIAIEQLQFDDIPRIPLVRWILEEETKTALNKTDEEEEGAGPGLEELDRELGSDSEHSVPSGWSIWEGKGKERRRTARESKHEVDLSKGEDENQFDDLPRIRFNPDGRITLVEGKRRGLFELAEDENEQGYTLGGYQDLVTIRRVQSLV